MDGGCLEALCTKSQGREKKVQTWPVECAIPHVTGGS